MEENIVLIDDLSIRDKIHIIRGVKVMLDFDLAEIYGYDTKNFNRQVKNNKEKFPEDMRFQLTREEVDYVSRCRNCTSIMQTAAEGWTSISSTCFYGTRNLYVDDSIAWRSCHKAEPGSCAYF